MGNINKPIYDAGDFLRIVAFLVLAIIPTEELISSFAGKDDFGVALEKAASEKVGNSSMDTAFLIHLLVVNGQG